MRTARVAVLMAVVSWSAPANANGRFPDAQQLVVNADDPDDIAVQTTYGFIRTRNGGASWSWTCEAAASYGGILDPAISVLRGDVLIAGVFDGLTVAEPDGCTMGLVPGDLESRFVVDVSRLHSDPARAMALSSDGLGNNQFDTRLWQTADSGSTWSPLGLPLAGEVLGFTLDAAPSDEAVIYVSGFRIITSTTYEGTLAVSQDGGESWSLKLIPGSGNDAGPYIAAIDPVDPATVYVRLSSLAGSLLVTHDAGDSWEVIFEGEGVLQAFALSPDGSELRVGGPSDGVWRASASALEFQKMNDINARCLTWTDDALYVCGREAVDDFTIGRSTDGGETYEPIHHLFCLEGPDAACPASSQVAETCAAPWAAQQDVISTDLCPGESDSGGAGGTGGAQGAGGQEQGGCNCRAASAPGSHSLAILPWLVALATYGRRKSLRKSRRF